MLVVNTLGGDLRHDLILTFVEVYFTTDGSISAGVDRADSAEVVTDLAALFSYDEVKAEPILALEASEVPSVQLASKLALGAVDDVHSAT